MERFTELADFDRDTIEDVIATLQYGIEQWVYAQQEPEFSAKDIGLTREPTPAEREGFKDKDFNLEAVARAFKVRDALQTALQDFDDLVNFLDHDDDQDDDE